MHTNGKKLLKIHSICKFNFTFFTILGLLFQIKSKPFFSTVNLDTTLLSLSIILTTASGYLINNFFDFNSDAINGKNQFYFLKVNILSHI